MCNISIACSVHSRSSQCVAALAAAAGEDTNQDLRDSNASIGTERNTMCGYEGKHRNTHHPRARMGDGNFSPPSGASSFPKRRGSALGARPPARYRSRSSLIAAKACSAPTGGARLPKHMAIWCVARGVVAKNRNPLDADMACQHGKMLKTETVIFKV